MYDMIFGGITRSQKRKWSSLLVEGPIKSCSDFNIVVQFVLLWPRKKYQAIQNPVKQSIKYIHRYIIEWEWGLFFQQC